MSLGPAVLQFTPRRDQVLALVAHFLEMNPILVVENSIICISRLVDSFADYENKLQIFLRSAQGSIQQRRVN